MPNISANIEAAFSNFEYELRKLGLSEASGALLIQAQVNGRNYIKSLGNLNQLASTATAVAGNKEFLTSFMKREIALSSNADSTIKLHYDTVKLIASYTPEIYLQNISYTYLQELELYMRKKKLAINTIARHMKTLKKYINIAIKKEIITKSPFANYTIRTEETKKEALTEEELLKLENYRIQLESPNETLNAFLFSCYTGLRYSDICQFDKQKIVSNNRKKWIILKTRKKNREVRIPITTIFGGKALNITKSINRSRGTLFRLGNSQQVGRNLKRIACATGIKKKITFHVARHTCATLLLHNGVSITTVQKILGHKSVKTTEIYSAVTDLTIDKELLESNRRRKIARKKNSRG